MSRALRVLTLIVAAAAFASADVGTAAQQSPAPPAAVSDASPSGKLAEVTVTAQKLARRISKFVNQIAAPENGGNAGLARWQAPPACPLVSGLPRQDGEFILERLSEIGHAAGAPMAGEHCHPNLYILVTARPEDLLRGMEKRNRPFTFGYDTSFYPPMPTPAGVVDAFIKTPRAVRVWYNSTAKDAWGKPLGYCSEMQLREATCLQVRGGFDDCSNPPPALATQFRQCGSAVAGGTHLAFNSIWTFSRVFVIVDRTQLQGVKLGQLADYVAMVGLAKIKPGAHLGDAPTILKLFDGAPQAAPTGMTDWDQSFLKGLYTTEQRSTLQRGQIARAMTRAIAPR